MPPNTTSVLVNSGCYNKVPETEVYKNNRYLYRLVLEVGSLRSQGANMVLGSGEDPLPGCGLPASAVTSCGGERREEANSHSYKGTNPIPKGSTLMASDPNYLPKTPLPNTIPLILHRRREDFNIGV